MRIFTIYTWQFYALPLWRIESKSPSRLLWQDIFRLVCFLRLWPTSCILFVPTDSSVDTFFGRLQNSYCPIALELLTRMGICCWQILLRLTKRMIFFVLQCLVQGDVTIVWLLMLVFVVSDALSRILKLIALKLRFPNAFFFWERRVFNRRWFFFAVSILIRILRFISVAIKILLLRAITLLMHAQNITQRCISCVDWSSMRAKPCSYSSRHHYSRRDRRSLLVENTFTNCVVGTVFTVRFFVVVGEVGATFFELYDFGDWFLLWIAGNGWWSFFCNHCCNDSRSTVLLLLGLYKSVTDWSFHTWVVTFANNSLDSTFFVAKKISRRVV